jgi:hypothetical protein
MFLIGRIELPSRRDRFVHDLTRLREEPPLRAFVLLVCGLL